MNGVHHVYVDRHGVYHSKHRSKQSRLDKCDRLEVGAALLQGAEPCPSCYDREEENDA